MAARERDDRKRRREREDELEAGIRAKLGKPQANIGVQRSMDLDASGGGGTEKLMELMDRAGPMIEQVNNLYNMFASGAERMPPIERRKQLEQIMNQLQLMHKASATLQFKYRSLYEHFVTFRDRWDKLMRDIESGKIRRTVGPGRR